MSVVIIVLLLLWIVPPIFIAPLVAAERDRSALGGFLLGLGLGWIGVGVVLLLGPNPQARSRQTQAPYGASTSPVVPTLRPPPSHTQRAVACPNCGFTERLKVDGVLVCGECGTPVDTRPPEYSGVLGSEWGDLPKKCPSCGFE